MSFGNILAVTEHHRQGDVSEAFLRDLEAWLHRDVHPETGENSVPKLLGALDRRLQRLVHSHASVWCHRFDDNGRRVVGTQSKLYLADPVLACVGPRLLGGLQRPDLGRLIEAALGVALGRTIDRLEPGRWMAEDTVGYVRSGKANEIDLGPTALPSPAGARESTPVQSERVSSGWPSAASAVERRFSGGVVATRTVLDSSRPP